MKNLILTLFLALLLTACGSKPMSDADMAAQYGLTMEAYQEQKEAAARMNMTIEDHLNMGHEEHGDHPMKMDVSSEIEAMSEEERLEHQHAAEKMGMTLEEHVEAGHVGH